MINDATSGTPSSLTYDELLAEQEYFAPKNLINGAKQKPVTFVLLWIK